MEEVDYNMGEGGAKGVMLALWVRGNEILV